MARRDFFQIARKLRRPSGVFSHVMRAFEPSHFSRGTPRNFHYAVFMSSSAALRLFALSLLGGVLPTLLADETPVTNDTPYRVIITRNAFDIKPPEPPPVIAPPAPPPPPPSNVLITGMIDVAGTKQVFFAVNRPGKPTEYLTLEEGATDNEITVLSIDSKTESVKIRNGGNESTLTFKDNSLLSKGAPGIVPQPGQPGQPGIPGAAPGVPPPPANIPGVRPGAQAAPNLGGPVIVGKRGEVQQVNLPTANFNNNAAANTGIGGGDYVQPSNAGVGGTGTRELPIRRARIEATPNVGVDPSTGAPVVEGARPTLPPNFLPPLPRSP